jgi:flagellin
MLSAVNNNTAFSVYTEYSTNSANLKKSMSNLSTGVKTIGDAGADVAISERMRSQADSTGVARQNVANGISVMQTADSWMQKTNDMLNRMHELAVSAQDGTKTSTDKSNLNTEFNALQDEIARVASETEFNGKKLFDGTFSNVSTQVGAGNGQTIDIGVGDTLTKDQKTDTLGDAGVTWGSVIDSSNMSVAGPNAIQGVTDAIAHMADLRAGVGGKLSRLNQTNSGLLSYEDNLRAAESQIRDVDAARESTELAKSQILTQTSNAMLAQANQLPSSILQLVG